MLKAGALYFAIVFAAGFLLGPVRVLWLEPRVGETLAVAIEMPFLIAVMAWAGWRVPVWTHLSPGLTPRLGMGLVALVLLQCAEISLGYWLRGLSFADQMARYGTPAGQIYAGALVIFVLAPALVAALGGRIARAKR